MNVISALGANQGHGLEKRKINTNLYARDRGLALQRANILDFNPAIRYLLQIS
jgi:hypothetical protein